MLGEGYECPPWSVSCQLQRVSQGLSKRSSLSRALGRVQLGQWPGHPKNGAEGMGGRTWPQSCCPSLSCILLLTQVLFKTRVIRNLALGTNWSFFFSVLLKLFCQVYLLRAPSYIYLSQGATVLTSDAISWWVPVAGMKTSFHGAVTEAPDWVEGALSFLPPPLVPRTWRQECQAGIFRRTNTLFQLPEL